eukprot:195661-Amphidinium_carterae.1
MAAYFACSQNSLAGTLPGNGLRLRRLVASHNRFAGVLPDGGIWKAVEGWELHRNGLTGTLPE